MWPWPVRRSRPNLRGVRHWPHLGRRCNSPGSLPDGVTVVEGIADLVYRDDDGTLVIADYKTDVATQAVDNRGVLDAVVDDADMIGKHG